MPRVGASKPGVRSHNYKGRNVVYRSAHTRINKLWGSAKLYHCVKCGLSAQEWAYDGTDPEQLTHMYKGRYPMYYSPDPEFYMPLCIPCHRARDLGKSVCVNGHELFGDNLIRVKSRPNIKRCRECYLAVQRRQHLRRKAIKCQS